MISLKYRLLKKTIAIYQKHYVYRKNIYVYIYFDQKISVGNFDFPPLFEHFYPFWECFLIFLSKNSEHKRTSSWFDNFSILFLPNSEAQIWDFRTVFYYFPILIKIYIRIYVRKSKNIYMGCDRFHIISLSDLRSCRDRLYSMHSVEPPHLKFVFCY